MSTASTASEGTARQLGATELSWCRAVLGGTGVTVLALLLRKEPDLQHLELGLHKLLSSHPILRSVLRRPTPTTFSLFVPTSPNIRLKTFSLVSTAEVLAGYESGPDSSTHLSSFQKILEHEMNLYPWADSGPSSMDGRDVFHASVYEYETEEVVGERSRKWVVVLKIHTSVCDRAAAVAVLRELIGTMLMASRENDGKGPGAEFQAEGEVLLPIEEYVPSNKKNKPFWARGMDMLGYSLNSFRLANLGFVDAESPRCSEVVRLEMDTAETTGLLEGCKRRGIELCGALGASGLMAARLCKRLAEGEWGKFALVTLIDCRPFLEPPLSSQHVGFYHSAILNTHDMSGTEGMWDLARRTYSSFRDAKSSNKHFSDMLDLNFLMCKAIENPGLTPSSSLRTSCMSVFEEAVIDHMDDKCQEIGLEDYMGCASVHGVGPSVAIFETIRDGRLDCILVYPAPLHSRAQMQEFADHMKKVLVAASSS